MLFVLALVAWVAFLRGQRASVGGMGGVLVWSLASVGGVLTWVAY